MKTKQKQSNLAQLLPILFSFLLLSACGGIGLGSSGSGIGPFNPTGGTNGDSGGEIFYQFSPASGDEDAGQAGGGYDGGYNGGHGGGSDPYDSYDPFSGGSPGNEFENDFEDDFGNGGGGENFYDGGDFDGGGYDDYSGGEEKNGGFFDNEADGPDAGDTNLEPIAEDEGLGMPVGIAKCEESDGGSGTSNLIGMLASSSSGTGSGITSSNNTVTETQPLVIQGIAGTFETDKSEDLSLYVLNLATGEEVTTDINNDGSFDSVTIQAQVTGDPIWVSAYDEEEDEFVNPYVFIATAPEVIEAEEDNRLDDDVCLVPSDEESDGILGSARSFDHSNSFLF